MFIFFWLVVACFGISTKVCFAQTQVLDKTSTEWYTEFVIAYREYQVTEEKFSVMRSKYKTYQTVISSSDMLESTKNLLAKELPAMYAYGKFIRTRLYEATAIINYQENLWYVKIDDELEFITLAKTRIDNLQSLEEAQSLATEFKKHYQFLSQAGYTIKSIIELKSTTKIFDNLKVEKGKMGKYLAETKAETDDSKAAREMYTDANLTLDGLGEQVALAEKQFNRPVTDGNENVARENAIAIRVFCSRGLELADTYITNIKTIINTAR